MTIEEIEIAIDEFPFPLDVENFLAEATLRIDSLFETEHNRKLPHFIPSNAVLLYKTLAQITHDNLPLGRVYCEWGSGYGVGTCLASLLGYEAYGIEIETELVNASRQLAEDLGIQISIIERDYMPEGFECYEGSGGAELLLPENYTFERDDISNVACYEGMEHALDEVDVFFVYPWPGEQEFMLEFFQAVAADGALFLGYFGENELVVYRKIAQAFE